MPVSTSPLSSSEHPAPHHQNPARDVGLAALVRTIGRVHVPAAGPWEIDSGQHLDLVARSLRTRALPARVQYGTLIVTDELLDSSLEFTVLVPDAGCCVGFSTRVTRLLAIDSWQADGTTTTYSGSHSVSLRLRSNGVFWQRGRQPCLWLTIETNVDLPELSVAVGSRRSGRLRIAAELNFNPRHASAR